MKNILFAVIAIALIVIGCKEEAKLKPKEYPILITKEVVDIDNTGATFCAEILDNGTEEIVDFGFVWWDSGYEFKTSIKENGGSIKEFKTRVSNDLINDVKYSCKAFIETADKMIYGSRVEFISKGSSPPKNINFSPKEGPDLTKVIITGENFSRNPASIKARINGIEATIISSTIDSIIIITPQVSFSGEASISLEINSQELILDKKFKILGPEIHSISKSIGFPGEFIHIEGENLTNNGNNIKVFFGNREAQIIDTSTTKLTLMAPAPEHYDVLEAMNCKINITNGLKTLEYPENFKILSPWMKKSSIFSQLNYMYSDKKTCSLNGKGYMWEQNSKTLYEYDFLSNQLYAISTFPGERISESLYLPLGNSIFKIGGEFMGRTKECWEFDLSEKKWFQHNDLPFDFYNAVYFIHEEKAFIITNKWEVWKFEKNKETIKIGEIPESEYSYLLLAFKGATGNHFVISENRTWEYNIASNSWIDKGAIDISCGIGYYTTVFGLNNTGYMISCSHLYKYNENTNKWYKINSMPELIYSGEYNRVFISGNNAYIASTHPSTMDAAFIYEEYAY